MPLTPELRDTALRLLAEDQSITAVAQAIASPRVPSHSRRSRKMPGVLTVRVG